MRNERPNESNDWSLKTLIFGPVSESNQKEHKVKVLIIRFSSIGDVVLTTPVIRCLKEQLYGDAEIHYVVRKPFVEVLENNPHIDVLHVLDKNADELLKNLEQVGFHYIIDLHKNLRSHLFRRRLKSLTFSIRKLNVQKWILVNLGMDLLPDLHIVDRYFEAVEKLGIVNDGKGLDYYLPEKDMVNTVSKYSVEADNYVAFAIGAAHEGKKLPLSSMKEICSGLNKKIVLIGGEEDAKNGESLAKIGKHVINACGQLSINQSASMLKQSRLVISHDSGMMHIASAFGKKIISIWGATVPKFGMYPYKAHPESIMIEAKHLKFRPTSKLGNRNSKKEKRTTEEIDPKEIIASVEKLW